MVKIYLGETKFLGEKVFFVITKKMLFENTFLFIKIMFGETTFFFIEKRFLVKILFGKQIFCCKKKL